MPLNIANQPNQLKHKAINPQKALPYIIHFVLCPVFIPTFSLQFHIDYIVDNTISISYNCGPAASLMIAGFVKFIENNIPSGIDINAIDQHINIYPLQLTQTEMAFRYVKLSDIVFRESSLNITLDMI